jgi:hypothetical protein
VGFRIVRADSEGVAVAFHFFNNVSAFEIRQPDTLKEPVLGAH